MAAIVILAFGLSLVGTLAAQEERPQIYPGERKAQRKKDAGPRAVGLIQLGSNGKASIIPLAILINGKFWDAGVYKADPVPMALDSGNVYEGERSGSSLGLFTVGSALHSNNPSAAMPWLGTGVWRANGTEAPTKAIKAESAPTGIGIDEAAPRLTRDTSAAKPAAPPANSAPPSSSGGGSPSGSKPSSNSGDEPPRLSKGNSAPSSDEPPTLSRPNTPSTPDQSKPGDSKPTDSKPSDSKPDDSKAAAKKPAQNVPPSDSGASDANRPRLRRGKPAESFADEEIPGYSLPGVKPAKAADNGKLVETVAANKDVQLIPAISDAAGPIPHSYAFEWIPGEEQDRRKQMIDLAKDQVRSYVAAKSKNNIASTATHAATAKRVLAPKPPEPELENIQMVAYDLWNSNQPVLILSARAHIPPSAGAASESDPEYSILLVAYPDIYHNLHKQFVAVTDKYHLDMTPRLELIDAVDADGDGVGDLLFRQTSDVGTGWVLYRVTADKLYKLFDSLNPV